MSKNVVLPKSLTATNRVSRVCFEYVQTSEEATEEVEEGEEEEWEFQGFGVHSDSFISQMKYYGDNFISIH